MSGAGQRCDTLAATLPGTNARAGARALWYRQMAAAAATFRLSTVPDIGMTMR